LSRIAKECRAPSSKDTTDALGAVDLAPGLEVAGVELGINLASSFHKIKRSYSSMSKTLD
jgi:hypothetical protein